MLKTVFDVIQIGILLGLIIFERYIEKHDFCWSFNKWFIHIKINVETEDDVPKLD